MSSSSRVQRIRLDESSLNSADESVGGGDGGGLWDDAEAGDGLSSGAASKPRELRPGDWVDTSRNGQLLCGIYICRSLATVRRLTVLASSGELVDVSLDDVIATVPSLVPASAPKRLTDYLAQYVEAREASTPSSTEAQSAPVVAEFPETLDMLQALRALEVDIERETQTLAAHGVHDIYRVVVAASRAQRSAAASAGGAVSVTVGSALAALRIPGKATRPRALALTRILLSQPQHFIADPLTLRHTARFDLRPPEEVERFETVRGWIRERTVEVEKWAEKCARVRQWARKQRSSRSDDDSHAHLSLVDLPANDPNFAWTPTDRTIFDFLRDTLARERLLQVQPHLALAPSLIKLVDAASARLGLPEWEQTREVQRLRIREFLAEVGVVAEWEDWAAHEKRTGLQTWDEAGDKVGEKVARARETTSSSARNDYYPSDPHDAVRHDFGSAAVYTIDDPGASELDDGISLVKGPPTSDGVATWWVHVHIADPTALLHPSHPLTNLARHRDHTVYFPEYTWPMLPDSFTVGEKLSLGANGQEGQRVLSLGSRIVESTGEVVETEVKAGVVREVRRLSYAAVDQALGYSAPRNGRTIENRAATSAEVEAEAMRTKRPTDDAALPNDPNAVAELGALQRLAKKLMRRRVDSSALFWQFPSSSVSVAPKPLRPHFETGTQPMFFSRSPHVSVRLPHPDDHSYVNSPAHLLVSEMMVAANRAAARFAVERGIAVPFRQQGAPTASPEALDAIMNLRDPDSGIAPATEVLKRRLEFLPGETTPTAGPHWPMGINDEYGYLRVTSPLRRYSDLYSHYQLKSALLPSNSSSSFAPRAGLSAVMTQIEGFNAAAKARHRLDGAAQAFWSLWVIKQKFDLLQLATAGSSSLPALGEADHITLDLLANGLTALAYRQPAHSSVQNLYIQAVLIPQLGIRGSLRLDKPEHGAEVGEEVPVQIEDITLGPRSKIVVALRS
ncbi:3'-5' RNA exonuclease complex component [Rhodotorula sphaerocarpa]